MRIFAIGAAALMLTVWGCQSWQESRAFAPMDTTTITATPQPDRPQTFIEALRESCIQYGSFTLEYEGVKEKYSCRKLN